MSQQLLITITTKDGASQTFRTIGSSATSMGNAIKSAATGAGGSVTKLGSESTKAASGMDRLDSSSRKAASGMADIEARAVKIGAALGTAVAALARFGAQAETQRRQVDGIQKAYGEAADEILKFTETIQDSTKFSNEDAREAAQIAATLAQNYGFTAQEVEKLIKVSADLAAVKGIDLADAVQRTSSAMRGEAESAEFLGLTLNQQAIDREGLTLKMSNEEAAHFRLNALLEQSAFAEGAAGEAAATAAGQAAQFANSVQDVTTGIGAALGPIAGATAGLADFALILPAAAAGIGKLATSLPNIGRGFTAMLASLGPVGIGLGVAAAAAGLVIKAWSDNEAANAALDASYGDLTAAIQETQSAQQQLASSNVRFDFPIQDQIKALGQFKNVADEFVETAGVGGETFRALTLDTTEQARANSLLATSFRQVDSAGIDPLIAAMSKLETETETFATSGDLALSALEDLNTALAYNGDGAEIVDAAVASLNRSYAAGTIDAQQYADGLDYIANNMPALVEGTRDAAQATGELSEEQLKAIAAIDKLAAKSRDALRPVDPSGALIQTPDQAAQNAIDLAAASEAHLQEKADEAAAALAEQQEQMRETAAALRDQLVPGLDGASSGFAGMVQPGEDVLDTLARIAPNVDNVGGSFLQFVDNLNDAQQALSGVLGMFDAIDALGGGAGQAESIATDLIGAPGEWATIDDLVSNAAISQGTYNRAVESGLSIQSNNLAIQEDLNAIRAQQLPLLDSQVTKVAAYVDGLAEASAAEQQQALYLMDSANQAKVAASYSTAYAASLGEIPPEVATAIIADGAQADPILADILEKFGLIEVGADGTVSVNFPDAATLDDVTTSIDRLNNTVVEVGVAMTGDTDLRANLVEANSELDALDGRVATATVKVELDSATADAALAGRGLPSGEAASAIKVPVEADTASFESSLDNLTTNKTVEVKVTADTSEFDSAYGAIFTGGGGGAAQRASVTVDIDANDGASKTIGEVESAAEQLDGKTYTALLEATDGATQVFGQASLAGYDFGITYTANLAAIDGASQPIGAAQLAGYDFATTYTATLAASDGASSVIGTAQSAATAFASAYTATLQAVDNASGTIDAVAAKLAALDGTTATTYITTQEISSLPTKLLGGAILPEAPHAATGRVVQVGEAGPEAVVLPFGSMVQPSPASPARTAQEDKPNRRKFDLPDVDLKEAYRKGGDSATAFYDGLLDKAKSRISEIKSELGSTIYGSRAEAENALRDYQGFLNQREKLKKLKDRAQGFDREQMQAARQAERAANDVTHTMDAAGEEIAASGADAGAAFSEELAAGIDVSSALDQVRVLKDEFVTSMMASAGAASDTQTAVHSFEKEIRDVIGSLRYSSKVSDAVSESVVEDFGTMEDAAITTGEAAGDELASGLESGAADATESLVGVSEQMNAIGEATIQPQIGADSKQATEALGQTSKELGVLDGDSAMVAIHVDDSEWQSFKDDVDNATLEATVETKTKDKSKDEEAKKLGGVILADEVPHAALGRVVTVGEAGPESVVLPFGAMVTPHPASAARLAAEPRPAMNFYAPVHVHAATPDIYAAIAAQLTGDGRQ